jgi:hypothetical protein
MPSPTSANSSLLAGSIVFIGAAGTNGPLLLLGVALLGAGFGNATSLPPLIAQIEFVKRDVPPVVALIVSIAQGAYAFAPSWSGEGNRAARGRKGRRKMWCFRAW